MYSNKVATVRITYPCSILDLQVNKHNLKMLDDLKSFTYHIRKQNNVKERKLLLYNITN